MKALKVWKVADIAFDSVSGLTKEYLQSCAMDYKDQISYEHLYSPSSAMEELTFAEEEGNEIDSAIKKEIEELYELMDADTFYIRFV